MQLNTLYSTILIAHYAPVPRSMIRTYDELGHGNIGDWTHLTSPTHLNFFSLVSPAPSASLFPSLHPRKVKEQKKNKREGKGEI